MAGRDLRVSGRPTHEQLIRDVIREEWGSVPRWRLLLELLAFALALLAIVVIVGAGLAMGPA